MPSTIPLFYYCPQDSGGSLERNPCFRQDERNQGSEVLLPPKESSCREANSAPSAPGYTATRLYSVPESAFLLDWTLKGFSQKTSTELHIGCLFDVATRQCANTGRKGIPNFGPNQAQQSHLCMTEKTLLGIRGVWSTALAIRAVELPMKGKVRRLTSSSFFCA